MRDPAFFELARRVEPAWSTARADRARQGIVRKAARRRAMTAIAGVALTAGIALVAARLTPSRSASAPIAVATIAAAHEVHETSATPLSADTLVEQEGGRAYVLRSGAARFVVEHDEARPFTVHAGDVVVEDVGTVFTVAYVGAGRLEVSVARGSVRVRHDGIASPLVAGERLEVDAIAHPVATAAPIPEQARPAPRDEVALLLRAADDARAAGNAEAALAPLRRVTKEHAGDSRAGLAAFTLGRVLLDELDRPNEAADAFANARAHGGPMAADALGREAVARARAGDADRARSLADEYLRLYPHGDRAREVERFASGR